ncbi:hypothetical protein GM708_07565 [Vibrio cholerae]|nr:hypothetical protein [Vibrio cholerae]
MTQDDGKTPGEPEPKGSSAEEERDELSDPPRSMRVKRFKELAALEKQGKLETVGEQEVRQYQSFKQSFSEMAAKVLATLQVKDKDFHATVDQIAAYQNFKPEMPPIPEVELTNHNEGMEDRLEAVIGALAEQREQDKINAKYLQVMAGTLTEIKASRELATRRQVEQETVHREQERFNRRMSWTALIVASVTLVSGIIIPLVTAAQG